MTPSSVRETPDEIVDVLASKKFNANDNNFNEWGKVKDKNSKIININSHNLGWIIALKWTLTSYGFLQISWFTLTILFFSFLE